MCFIAKNVEPLHTIDVRKYPKRFALFIFNYGEREERHLREGKPFVVRLLYDNFYILISFLASILGSLQTVGWATKIRERRSAIEHCSKRQK